MKVNKLNLMKLIFFLNCVFVVKTLSDELKEEKSLGSDKNLMTQNNLKDQEQNNLIMEEKMKSLLDKFNELELKMDSVINDSKDVFEKRFQKMIDQIVEDIKAKIEQIIKEKTKSIERSKISYKDLEPKCSNNSFPTNCFKINECQEKIYSIMIPEVSTEPIPAACDLRTLDGGWTIIQRRQDGSENFYRNWTDYVDGFGDLNGEFFIGLEKLYALTSLGEPQELYIILEDFEGERRYARYGEFKIGSNITDYKLTVSQYSGDAGDCFSGHSGHKFSTRDRDNDVYPEVNCAERSKGAWWYTKCFFSNLNGLYLAGKMPKSKRGTSWCLFHNGAYSLKFVQMMIRPNIN